MNRIDRKFCELREQGVPAFIPFFTAGDPDLETTEKLIVSAERAGADLIELGFPYSDPIADGPTIQASYTRALDRGQRTEDVFRLVSSLREKSEIPVVAMISYSLVFRMSFEQFMEEALKAGIDGATIPDLPVEESEDYQSVAAERDFHVVNFVTPETTDERRDAVVRLASGFIYYIAVRGITGARASLPDDLVENIDRLKARTDVPVAVGFGISQPEHARSVGRVADGVIVGSAILKRINRASEEGQDPVEAASAFVEEMARAAKQR